MSGGLSDPVKALGMAGKARAPRRKAKPAPVMFQDPNQGLEAELARKDRLAARGTVRLNVNISRDVRRKAERWADSAGDTVGRRLTVSDVVRALITSLDDPAVTGHVVGILRDPGRE